MACRQCVWLRWQMHSPCWERGSTAHSTRDLAPLLVSGWPMGAHRCGQELVAVRVCLCACVSVSAWWHLRGEGVRSAARLQTAPVYKF